MGQCRSFAESWEGNGQISTIFVGGGTPTIYGGEVLARLLEACRSIFTVVPQAECSVESNPNTASHADFEALLKAGVNRLSIGVQAFDEGLLSVLGRSHSVDEAVGAIGMAREVGFSNINIDLMYGLPTQTATAFRRTLDQALALDPQHIALYELSVEENTQFAQRFVAGDLLLPEEAEIIEMEELVQFMLMEHGYERYEISNYARAGFRCAHNTHYWHNGDYFGVGAGAVSYLDGIRITNVSDPKSYTELVCDNRPPYAQAEALSTEAAFRESVIMGLRMIDGIELERLKKRFDIHPIAYYGEIVEKLRDQGLIVIEDGWVRLTERSLPVANQVLSALV